MVIQRMTTFHINEVYEIEKSCFSIPWSKKSFENEILNNKKAIYLVALEDLKVIGYSGMWHILDEAHITNIAVHKDYRKIGVASKMIENLINFSNENNIKSMTLEVRKSNFVAQDLYKKFGFKIEGIRKEYYEDKEDAMLMWKYI